jgi:hypothetical protein
VLCVASVEIDADLLAASRDEKVNALYRVYPLAPETDLPAYTFRHGGCLLMKHIGKTFDALPPEDLTKWKDQALVHNRKLAVQRAAKAALAYRQGLVWSEDKICQIAGPCACKSCKDFRCKVPSGKPLLCSLTELSDANPGGQKDVLCSFSGLTGGQGRELDWGESTVQTYADYSTVVLRHPLLQFESAPD